MIKILNRSTQSKIGSRHEEQAAAGVRDGRGEPGAFAAERISGRREPYFEGEDVFQDVLEALSGVLRRHLRLHAGCYPDATA